MTQARDFSDLPTRAQLLSMSGYEFMCAMRDGTLPRPPIARVLCYELTEVSDGAVTFTGTPQFDHTNPMGGLHGGWYGAVLTAVWPAR
jgi:acyl-coenzyme A thioesterase PaaI-like protein